MVVGKRRRATIGAFTSSRPACGKFLRKFSAASRRGRCPRCWRYLREPPMPPPAFPLDVARRPRQRPSPRHLRAVRRWRALPVAPPWDRPIHESSASSPTRQPSSPRCPALWLPNLLRCARLPRPVPPLCCRTKLGSRCPDPREVRSSEQGRESPPPTSRLSNLHSLELHLLDLHSVELHSPELRSRDLRLPVLQWRGVRLPAPHWPDFQQAVRLLPLPPS